MSDVKCFACGRPLDPRTDEWWSYQWREQPAPDAVEAAIEQGDAFGGWFQENHVLCPGCHGQVQRAIGPPGVHPESTTVLASVAPEHATAILGTRSDADRPRKRFEYRRQPPAQPTPYRLVLYATASETAIVGEAVVTEHVTGPVGTVVYRTVGETAQDAADVWAYFEGCDEATALRLARPRAYGRSRLPLARCRELVAGFQPPQNFQYLRPDAHAPLLDRLPPREACPGCGSYVWLPGLCGASEVPGEGEYRAVHHCGVCERAVVRHAAEPLGVDGADGDEDRDRHGDGDGNGDGNGDRNGNGTGDAGEEEPVTREDGDTPDGVDGVTAATVGDHGREE